jgi:uncharacterized membrane protein
MSSVQSPSSTANRRPITVPIAAVLLAAYQLLAIVPTGEAPDDIPKFVSYISIGTGIISLIAAIGLWRRKKWAVVTAILVLVTAPGIIFGPVVGLQLEAAAGVTIGLAIIALILLPASRRAYA